MADFQLVMNEKLRMCNSFQDCTDGCKLNRWEDCNRALFYQSYEAEEIIMEWSKSHPKVQEQDN